MKSLIYNSKASREFSLQELVEMASSFANKNSQLQVTGYLCYQKQGFFQYVEGESDTLSQLMRSIEQDARHHVIRRYEESNISQRRFPDWSMNYLRDSGDPEISLDDIIAQHFVDIDEIAALESASVGLIWRAVDRIAGLQAKLSNLQRA